MTARHWFRVKPAPTTADGRSWPRRSVGPPTVPPPLPTPLPRGGRAPPHPPPYPPPQTQRTHTQQRQLSFAHHPTHHEHVKGGAQEHPPRGRLTCRPRWRRQSGRPPRSSLPHPRWQTGRPSCRSCTASKRHAVEGGRRGRREPTVGSQDTEMKNGRARTWSVACPGPHASTAGGHCCGRLCSRPMPP